MSVVGNVRGGKCPSGKCPSGKCPWWEVSVVGSVRGGKCPWWEVSVVGSVRGGKCPGWEMSVGGMCPWWEMSVVGNVRGGKCPWWEMSVVGSVREPFEKATFDSCSNRKCWLEMLDVVGIQQTSNMIPTFECWMKFLIQFKIFIQHFFLFQHRPTSSNMVGKRIQHVGIQHCLDADVQHWGGGGGGDEYMKICDDGVTGGGRGSNFVFFA